MRTVNLRVMSYFFACIVSIALLPMGCALDADIVDGKIKFFIENDFDGDGETGSNQDCSNDDFLDVDWYKNTLIQTVDLWNGGFDGEGGMGAYADGWDGFFNVNINREWEPQDIEEISTVAFSRGIYMNVEAYIAAGPKRGKRFLETAIKGADYLLAHFWDEEYGGFYWLIDPEGNVVSDVKQGYGNVHPLMVLARVYGITQDPKYYSAVIEQLEVLQDNFMDPTLDGAFLPGFTRDFSEIDGYNNIDCFTHYFEALLSLYDVTKGEDHAWVADLINEAGQVLIEKFYQNQEGYTDRGYVAYNYTEEWEPQQTPYTREEQWTTAMHSTPGHCIEFAYLLSRAVERGFCPLWLTTAKKLLKFSLEYAVDPDTGGMKYEILDYVGQPISENPDNAVYIWWAQAETARAQMHYAVLRDHQYMIGFKKAESFIQNYLIDPVYGGWFRQLDVDSLVPPDDYSYNKGDVWKVNYHATMLMAEAIRLKNEREYALAVTEQHYDALKRMSNFIEIDPNTQEQTQRENAEQSID